MANSVTSKTNVKVDKWLKAILASDYSVKVGIIADPETKGADSAQSSKKGRGQFGIEFTNASLLKVAAVHEFGYEPKNIRPRSYLRSTWDENQGQVYVTLFKLIEKVGLNYGASKSKQKKVFALMGEWLVNKVKIKFTKNTWPALKDPTRGGRNKKGKSKPLIDTGQLRASISYQVVEGEK